MQNKKWKQFDKISEKCYLDIAKGKTDDNSWLKGFELLKEIVLEEKTHNPNSTLELETLDENTDYEHDIQGWLEDCLDEFEIVDKYETLLNMCNDLLDLFDWPAYTGSDIKFRKISSLLELHKEKEALDFCEEWLKKEPENIMAATATVYAFIDSKEYDQAEKLVNQFISNPSECTDDNEIMFMAASKLYDATNQKKKKKEIDQAMDKYIEAVNEYLTSLGFDDDIPF